MFDVGFAELLLLSLIALLVLGPERLPRVARTLGGLSRRARSSWLSLKRSIDEEIRARDLKEPVDKVRKDFQETASKFRSTVDEAKKSAEGLSASVSSPKPEPAPDPEPDPAPDPEPDPKHEEKYE